MEYRLRLDWSLVFLFKYCVILSMFLDFSEPHCLTWKRISLMQYTRVCGTPVIRQQVYVNMRYAGISLKGLVEIDH